MGSFRQLACDFVNKRTGSMLIFSHVGLNCNDIDRTEAFYVKHFGFQGTRRILLGEDKIVFLKAGDVCLELFKAKGTPPDRFEKDGPAYAGYRHMAFQVDNVEAMLQTMGEDAKVTLGPLRFDDFIKGWKTVWIRDPDGRIVEMSEGYKD
jgi:glyoxylase I family protein